MSFLNVPIAALVTKNTLSSFQREKAIFNDSVRLTTSSLFLLPLVTVFFFSEEVQTIELLRPRTCYAQHMKGVERHADLEYLYILVYTHVLR